MTTFAPSRPETVTKNLAFNNVGGRRKVRLSTNFLPLLGFANGDRLAIEEPTKPHQGFTARRDLFGTHQVHSRRYNHKRTNNPHEALVEFASQELLDRAFPSYTERFHVEMRHGQIHFRPIANRAAQIINRLRKTSPWNAFVALTGGVDVHLIDRMGWKTEVVLEHRPQEARDIASGSNKTETNALNCLQNAAPKIVINEDMYHVDVDRLAKTIERTTVISTAVFSLQCDDFSQSKSKADKARSLDELSTTVDQVYPALRQINAIKPAVVVVENVPGFRDHGAGQILRTSLRRMGYHVEDMVLDARDFGGLQSRRRFYLVASVWPGYAVPAPQPRSTDSIWNLVEPHLANCRDVTDSATMKARRNSDRHFPAFITPDSTHCPTVLKSQNRGTKDAVYIQHEGRILAPPAALIQQLMSIPASFDVSWMSKEMEMEALGQSLDGKLHEAVLASVKAHITANTGRHTLVTAQQKIAA